MDSAVDIRVAGARERQKQTFTEEIDNLVCPGDVITTDTGFMRYGSGSGSLVISSSIPRSTAYDT